MRAAVRVHRRPAHGRSRKRRSGGENHPESEHAARRLWSRWLSEIKNEVDETTLELYELHGTTHMVPFFVTLGAISTAACASYGRKAARRRKARHCEKKEQSTLRRFLYWCAEQGYIDEPPIVSPSAPLSRNALPHPPPRTRHRAQPRRGPCDHRSLARMVRSSQHEALRGSLRFVVEFETTLRPATLDALSVPEHYQPGATCLRITDEIDKTRAGREVPLSAQACEALDAIAPKQGPALRCSRLPRRSPQGRGRHPSCAQSENLHGLRPPPRPPHAARRNRQPDGRRVPRRPQARQHDGDLRSRQPQRCRTAFSRRSARPASPLPAPSPLASAIG